MSRVAGSEAMDGGARCPPWVGRGPWEQRRCETWLVSGQAHLLLAGESLKCRVETGREVRFSEQKIFRFSLKSFLEAVAVV